MLSIRHILKIYYYVPFFAKTSISFAGFIAIFVMLKLLDQMLLLQIMFYVNQVRLIFQLLSGKRKHTTVTLCICKAASRSGRLAKFLSLKPLAVSSNLIVVKVLFF